MLRLIPVNYCVCVVIINYSYEIICTFCTVEINCMSRFLNINNSFDFTRINIIICTISLTINHIRTCRLRDINNSFNFISTFLDTSWIFLQLIHPYNSYTSKHHLFLENSNNLYPDFPNRHYLYKQIYLSNFSGRTLRYISRIQKQNHLQLC